MSDAQEFNERMREERENRPIKLPEPCFAVVKYTATVEARIRIEGVDESHPLSEIREKASEAARRFLANNVDPKTCPQFIGVQVL